MTPAERADQIITRKLVDHASIAEIRNKVAKEIREAVAAERERCLDWVASEARDCGCSSRIAVKIRESQE